MVCIVGRFALSAKITNYVTRQMRGSRYAVYADLASLSLLEDAVDVFRVILSLFLEVLCLIPECPERMKPV
jgi:hypothetical protein